MQIKQNLLSQYIQKNSFAIYWLAGQDAYLIEDSLKTIKNHIKNSHECDEKIISLQLAEDWKNVPEEANHYSLFSEVTLLNIFYDKKSLDATGKKIISEYLTNINSRCFIIIRTPNIPSKQLNWLASLSEVLLIIHHPLNAEAIASWIAERLRKSSFTFDVNLPTLISQYTQGNRLACAQVIDKLILSYTPNSHITVQQGFEHLFDQCEYNLFELIDALLLGNVDKSIQIIRRAANNKTEAPLVLWMLAQEIRILLQLNYLVDQNITVPLACKQLKIWPQRIPMYQTALKRLSSQELRKLMSYCLTVDEQIKSNLNTQVWNNLERIVISLCKSEFLPSLIGF